MENLEPPSPSKSRMGKWRVLALRAASSLIWGDGGLLFHFILSQIAIVDKINGKTRPPLPPNSTMEKSRVFVLRAASSLTWGEGGLLFHSILSKIVDPRGNEFVRTHYVIAGR